MPPLPRRDALDGHRVHLIAAELATGAPPKSKNTPSFGHMQLLFGLSPPLPPASEAVLTAPPRLFCA